jgi:hypothetical protein
MEQGQLVVTRTGDLQMKNQPDKLMQTTTAEPGSSARDRSHNVVAEPRRYVRFHAHHW